MRVELYAEPRKDAAPVRQPMVRGEELSGAVNGYVSSATVPATRPASDYTPRVVPHHADARPPLEEKHILWQR